jgi:hypothetical protein
MASEVEICNAALSKIGISGNNRITSLSQNTKNAKACDERYATLRDLLLEQHPWNFALKRVQLAASTEAPSYEFTYAYSLPPDWIRTIAVYDNDAGAGEAAFRHEGKALVSDAAQLWLKYVMRLTDPNTMPPTFREALATYLAWELAIPLANSNRIQEAQGIAFRRTLNLAKFVDARNDRPEQLQSGSWFAARS